MAGDTENYLPDSWFRVTRSDALDSDLGGRYKPFWTAAQGIPTYVVLLNEQPFAYYDLTKEISPAEGHVWVPKWDKESIHLRSKEGGMKNHAAKQFFDLVNKHCPDLSNATPEQRQEASALAFTCHKMCEKLVFRNWDKSDNLDLFREAGDTSLMFQQLAHAYLHRDVPFIEATQQHHGSNIAEFHKPIKDRPWTSRAGIQDNAPGGEVVTFPTGGNRSK